MKHLLDDAVARGAAILTGAVPTETIMNGIVVDHVTPDMELFREESFTPQASNTRVNGMDEAIKLANDTVYGLSSAVYTRNIAEGMMIAARLETGVCHVNGLTVHGEPLVSCGGVKGSRYGRFGGKAAIDAFTKLRWITVQLSPRHYPC